MSQLLTAEKKGIYKPSPSEHSELEALSAFESHQRERPSCATTDPHESLVNLIKNFLRSAIGIHASGLDVMIDADSVIVTGEVPSFYIRQLIEHNSRLIIVDRLRRKFVPNVVVCS